MNRLLSVVVVAFVLLAPCAFGDSININITYVTASMGPNAGSGDNISFTLIGPGTRITGVGGMACFAWCSGPIPDLNSVATSQVFISFFTSALVGGINYDPNSDIAIFCCLFSGSGDLNGSASGFVGEGETFKSMNLTLPGGGGWNLNFTFFPASGGSPPYYQFVNGTFTAGTPPAEVPEPGTLGLMAMGMAGIVGALRRKRLIHQQTTN